MTLAVVTFDRIPHAAPAQPLPDSDQVTPLFERSFANVAVKFCVCPAVTFADDGEMFTAIPATIVIVAEDDFVESLIEVAVRTTLAGDGTDLGAM